MSSKVTTAFPEENEEIRVIGDEIASLSSTQLQQLTQYLSYYGIIWPFTR